MRGAISLDEVIATSELARRPLRTRDEAVEAVAMADLQRALAGSPRSVLQALAEAALRLCGAQSAGISLLEKKEGQWQFRWLAAAGEWAYMLWSTQPRDNSPCGTVLDRGTTLLMIDPGHFYPQVARRAPSAVETLLVPFRVGGEIVGTLWVVSHDAQHRFDAEDERLIETLTSHAAAAYERLVSFKPDDVRELSRMHVAPDWPPRRRS